LIPLSEAASLTGTIVDAAGPSVAHAMVELESGTNRYAVQADNAGVFQFSNLPAGEYTLTVTASGFWGLTIKSIEILENERKRIPELMLDLGDCGHGPSTYRLVAGDPTFGSLSGSVIGAAAVEVTLVCRTFSECRSTRTDSAGRFSFATLSPGEYGLNFRREGYYPKIATGYFIQVKAGLESVYSPVTLEPCRSGNCDPKLRPKRPVVLCE
jgi:hypothetical protein